MSGRLVSDNILLAHEMFHALQTNPRCNEDFMAFKIDMSGLIGIVRKIGFDNKWID